MKVRLSHILRITAKNVLKTFVYQTLEKFLVQTQAQMKT
jgi:hypothetical protein